MKEKRKKSKYLIFLGNLLILMGIIIIFIPFFVKEVDQKNNIIEVHNFINHTSSLAREEKETGIDETQVLMVVEVPKINLKRTVYDFKSSKNHIRYNIQIMKESSLPNELNGNVILSAHNGSASNSFFGKLHLLEINDLVNIYYDGNKYVYSLDKIYDVVKDGTVEVKRDNSKNTLTLVTCKKNTLDKQLVLILYLKEKVKY